MKKFVTPFLMAVLLSGCSLVPEFHLPGTNSPAAFSSGVSEETRIAADWWQSFDSEELNGLMVQALAQNNDLRASVQRVEQSRAALRVAGASLLPTADASASKSRVYNNPGNANNSWRGGAGVSYELDLFGANRAGVEAADAQLKGSQYDHDALALVVMGDVAKGYFNLLNLRQRTTIAESNLKTTRDVLNIVEARFKAGASSELEVAQQKTSLASNESTLASIQQQVSVAENALAVLLGQPPQTLPVEGDNLKAVNVPVIAPGQPSTLLERRPDIRSSEAGLVAANANIGAARAAFFPSISLGVDAAIAGDPISRSLSLAGSLVAPIFEGGRLEGNLESTKARRAELVENYHKTVLVSFQEVEDALSAAKAAQARERALAEAQTQAQKSYDLSLQLYKAGSIDFQTLLNTQTALLSAQDSYASVKLGMLNAAVDLYKALGGGWDSGTSPG